MARTLTASSNDTVIHARWYTETPNGQESINENTTFLVSGSAKELIQSIEQNERANPPQCILPGMLIAWFVGSAWWHFGEVVNEQIQGLVNNQREIHTQRRGELWKYSISKSELSRIAEKIWNDPTPEERDALIVGVENDMLKYAMTQLAQRRHDKEQKIVDDALAQIDGSES